MKLSLRRANTSSLFRQTLAVVALARLASLPGQADVPGTKPLATCTALSERTVHEYAILSATDLEATGDIAERCNVLGVPPPEIVFGVVLPSEWNGRIMMRGNGGHAGSFPDTRGGVRASDRIVADGFVSVYTNAGHDRAIEPLGAFAFNDRQTEIDYILHVVRLTIQTAKELVGSYYGQPPSYTDRRGCSTVGRAPMQFLCPPTNLPFGSSPEPRAWVRGV